MKKITKKQMKQLKGMLNDMDYKLTEPINFISIPLPANATNQTAVCRVPALQSDND